MAIRNILFIFLFLSLFIETTFISFPLFFVLAAIIWIFYPDAISMVSIFVFSLVLDSLKLAPPGSTALVLAISFVILEAVKRFFDTHDYKFILVFLLISSYAYAKWASYNPGVFSYIALYFAIGLSFYYFLSKKILWLK